MLVKRKVSQTKGLDPNTIQDKVLDLGSIRGKGLEIASEESTKATELVKKLLTKKEPWLDSKSKELLKNLIAKHGSGIKRF